jgi:hypothetical protein
VLEVGLHLFELETFEMAFSNHTRSKRSGCVIKELIDKGIVACKHQRHNGFGVEVELKKCMHLSENLHPHEMGFVTSNNNLS